MSNIEPLKAIIKQVVDAVVDAALNRLDNIIDEIAGPGKEEKEQVEGVLKVFIVGETCTGKSVLAERIAYCMNDYKGYKIYLDGKEFEGEPYPHEWDGRTRFIDINSAYPGEM